MMKQDGMTRLDALYQWKSSNSSFHGVRLARMEIGMWTLCSQTRKVGRSQTPTVTANHVAESGGGAGAAVRLAKEVEPRNNASLALRSRGDSAARHRR
jgi:hypothetical protein